MKKTKTINLIEFIIQGSILILIFVPGTYQETYWKVNEMMAYGGWTSKWTIVVSHWSKSMSISDTTAILLWTLIIIICIALTIYLIQCLGKKKEFCSKTSCLLAIVELVIFIVSAFFTHTYWGDWDSREYESYFDFSPYIIFPIIIALMIASIILSIIQLKTSKQECVDDMAEEHSTNLAADELKKFKDLLDMGAISQEEFQAKKAQLLKLI